MNSDELLQRVISHDEDEIDKLLSAGTTRNQDGSAQEPRRSRPLNPERACASTPRAALAASPLFSLLFAADKEIAKARYPKIHRPQRKDSICRIHALEGGFYM